MNQKEIIIKYLNRIFNGPAWHGPTVLETLNKVVQDNSNNAFKDSHSLIEIINHMTAWRIFVIEQLRGNHDFIITEELNFPKTTDLRVSIDSLKKSQQTLMDSISKFPEERLAEKVGERKFTYQSMLHGIIHHDLYHLGQISLLNR